MNANELADELENIYWVQGDGKGKPFQQYADFVRQQQAEIKALKKSCLDEIFKRTYANQSAKVMEGYWQEAQVEIEALKLQLHTTLTNRDLRTYDGKTEMNNEPVAWMLNGIIHECDPSDWAKEQYPDQDVIPLYTHPVKALTNEEIALTWNEFSALQNPKDIKDFARAILRKAQEK